MLLQLNNHVAIANGFAEVKLIKNIIGEETGIIENQMLDIASKKHGDRESQVNLTLLFVLAGTELAGTTG